MRPQCHVHNHSSRGCRTVGHRRTCSRYPARTRFLCVRLPHRQAKRAPLTSASTSGADRAHPPGALWTSKSAELEDELRRVRAEMAHHERASHDYERTGLQILELAQTAYSLYVAQNPLEQARLLKTLLSNCTFERGTLCPTYRKPFDLFAKGTETGDWLTQPGLEPGTLRLTGGETSAFTSSAPQTN
jgi:hypothetical protein